MLPSHLDHYMWLANEFDREGGVAPIGRGRGGAMTEDLVNLTIGQLSRLIESREASPREIVEAYLRRIERLDPLLATYVTVTVERAQSEAKAAEDEIMRGRYRGPLHGIPFALKDIIDVAGIRTTACSRLLEDNFARCDATCVALLHAAGAVLLGKLTTYELATGGPSFDLPWPPARNPWNLDHNAGGSSSGAGAAVAGGLALFALGSDTGGSIRVPSAYCGVTGLKPTFGRVSMAGVVPLSESFDTVGPLCRTAEDCALVLQAIASPDPDDPVHAAAPADDYVSALASGLDGVRIGVVRSFYEDEQASEPVVAAMTEAVDTFRRLGAEIREVCVSPLADYGACARIIAFPEKFLIHKDNLIARPEVFGEVFRYRVLAGVLVSASDYIAATWLQRKLTVELLATLNEVDVLVTATTLGPAPAFEAMSLTKALQPFLTAPFSLAKVPAVSLCCGFSPENLPLGMQIAGCPFNEATVLRVAHAYQQATSWHRRRPPLTTTEGTGRLPSSRTPGWRHAKTTDDPELDDYVVGCVRQNGLRLGDDDLQRLRRGAEDIGAMTARIRKRYRSR
jgi:aspartyl-tRNA(Asn)/glutamyl-tRNA(Gln) amidotransferase subunit A